MTRRALQHPFSSAGVRRRTVHQTEGPGDTDSESSIKERPLDISSLHLCRVEENRDTEMIEQRQDGTPSTPPTAPAPAAAPQGALARGGEPDHSAPSTSGHPQFLLLLADTPNWQNLSPGRRVSGEVTASTEASDSSNQPPGPSSSTQEPELAPRPRPPSPHAAGIAGPSEPRAHAGADQAPRRPQGGAPRCGTCEGCRKGSCRKQKLPNLCPGCINKQTCTIRVCHTTPSNHDLPESGDWSSSGSPTSDPIIAWEDKEGSGRRASEEAGEDNLLAPHINMGSVMDKGEEEEGPATDE